MSTIHFNPNQDDHSSSPSFLHLHPYEVIGDEALGRKKEISDLKFTILKSYNNNNNQYGDNNDYYHNNGTSSSSSSSKIESPKIRLYRKFMSSNDNDDQRIEDQNLKHDDVSPRESCGENTTNNIRICADCGTTKTPLWRGGPHGPKSLCNACGIRQRKARRAAMAASDTTCATNNSSCSNTNNKLNNLLPNKMGFSSKMKKRSKNRSKKPLLTPNIDDKTTTTKTKKICFQEFALNLSNKLSLHQFFPQDEKEAAILLMALSSGFVEG